MFSKQLLSLLILTFFTVGNAHGALTLKEYFDFKRAEKLIEKGEHSKADSILSLLSDDEKEYITRYSKGLNSVSAGDFESALDHFETSKKVAPSQLSDLIDFNYNRTMKDLGLKQLEEGDFQKGRRNLEKSIQGMNKIFQNTNSQELKKSAANENAITSQILRELQVPPPQEGEGEQDDSEDEQDDGDQESQAENNNEDDQADDEDGSQDTADNQQDEDDSQMPYYESILDNLDENRDEMLEKLIDEVMPQTDRNW